MQSVRFNSVPSWFPFRIGNQTDTPRNHFKPVGPVQLERFSIWKIHFAHPYLSSCLMLKLYRVVKENWLWGDGMGLGIGFKNPIGFETVLGYLCPETRKLNPT